MTGPNEIDPPQPTAFEALVRRLAEEAIATETVTVDDILNGGRLTSRYLERFAGLVAEECAKLCEAEADPHERSRAEKAAKAAAGKPDELDRLRHVANVNLFNAGPRNCAGAIRAAFTTGGNLT
jgi:aminopeptidase N